MPAFLPIALTMSEPKFQKKANNLLASVEKIICRIKGSCSPKFIAAVAKVGAAGYRRGTPNAWSYYLPNGICLTQDLSKFYNAVNWYMGSGYWESLKQAGLDECCLKQKWPPTEAFPLVGLPLKESLMVKLPNGLQIEVDPDKFDPNTFQQELDEYFKKKGGVTEPPPTGSGANGTGAGTTTPITASLSGLLPLALLFALKN